MTAAEFIPVIGMVAASALGWGAYVDAKDRLQPEPRGLLLLAFVLGGVAAVLALGLYTLLDLAGMPLLEGGPSRWTALYCFGVIGPIEEGCKVLVALLFVFRWRQFDEPIDGFVYAACISYGFATVENLMRVPGLSLIEQLAYTLTLPLTHSLFAAVWGFGIAHARLQMKEGPRRRYLAIGSILLAMLLHGAYDFILFAWQATLVTSGMALVLWLAVIWRCHGLLHPVDPPAEVGRR